MQRQRCLLGRETHEDIASYPLCKGELCPKELKIYKDIDLGGNNSQGCQILSEYVGNWKS